MIAQLPRIGQQGEMLIEDLVGPVQQMFTWRQLFIHGCCVCRFCIEQVAHAVGQVGIALHPASQQMEFEINGPAQQPAG